MWQKIKTFVETNPGLHAVLLHGLLIVGFITVVFVAVEVCEGLAREYADRWEKDLSSISCNGDGSSELFPLPRGVGTGPQSVWQPSLQSCCCLLPWMVGNLLIHMRETSS